MPKLQVLCKQENLDAGRASNQVVIVLDILFATSTIVHAFSEGAESVWLALDRDEAGAMAATLGQCLCAGEHLTETLPGFAPAVPLALGRHGLRHRALVYCTTNGTVALRRASAAAFVYPGALLNGAALVAHILREHPDAPVLIICAGSVGRFNLEDFYGAGHLVSHFNRQRSGYLLNDAAMAATLLHRGCDARTALLSSRVGRLMCERSLQDEVEYAACHDRLPVVARLEGDRVCRVVS
jgi:2-phosphosulfolactate phosphatase